MSLTSRKIPRAPDPNGAFVVNGAAWNAMADAVEKISHLAISPPLTLTDTGNNVCIGIQPGLPGVIPVVITAEATGTGWYKGTQLAGSIFANETVNLAEPLANMTAPTNQALVIYNPYEDSVSSGLDGSGHDFHNQLPAYGAAVILGTSSTTGGSNVAMLLNGTPNRIFPVQLSKQGGADGSTNAAATWTYAATNMITGVALSGGTLAGSLQRPFCSTKPATFGIVIRTSTTVLFPLDEVFNVSGTNCT